ncbi:MAG: flagellar motor protein MotB [Acidobacteriota bacterium]
MRNGTQHGRVNHERWLVSYADFITLLFAFFVVLYAFARADEKKQQAITQAVDRGFNALGLFAASHDTANQAGGVEHAALPVNIVMGEQFASPGQVKTDLEQMHRDLEHRLATQLGDHTVAIKMGRDGLVISLKEEGFFDSGSATPHPGSIGVLRQIAAALSASPYDVRVEGHTDNVPIHSDQFASNWELSSARATHIARLLLDLHAVNPEKLSAAGFAEFHPVDTNDTPQGRANNRRVDLVIQPRSQIDLRSLSGAGPTGPWRKITDAD